MEGRQGNSSDGISGEGEVSSGVVTAVVGSGRSGEMVGEGVGCLLMSKELPLRISKDGRPRPMSLDETGERRMSNDARPRVARGVGEGGEGDVAADGLLGLAPVT